MEVEMTQENCINCGIVFCIPMNYHNRLVKCKNTFYCPNGHNMHYLGETDKQKLERESRKNTNLKDRNAVLFKSNAALRGVITRMKNKQVED